ncbi:MAG: hypothetical protein LIP12_06415 [Clostridiales bacterium]|nr:hypothetical protein [Clostridiales bacterium]
MKKFKKLAEFVFAVVMAFSILCTSMTAFAEEISAETETEAMTESGTSEETITFDSFKWLSSMVLTFTDENNPGVSYEIYCDDIEQIWLRKLVDGEVDGVEVNICTQGLEDTYDEYANLLFDTVEYYFSTIPQMLEIQGLW